LIVKNSGRKKDSAEYTMKLIISRTQFSIRIEGTILLELSVKNFVMLRFSFYAVWFLREIKLCVHLEMMLAENI